MDTATFINDITKGYTFEGESILLGAAVLDGKPIKESFIRIPLATINRQGLSPALPERERQKRFKC